MVERYAYDAYGNPRIMNSDWTARTSGSDYANSVLFAGYWRDAKTGLYCVRNRTFHPLYGRWMQRDPLGYADGMSLYEYVGSRVGGAAFAAYRIARGAISANLDQAFIPNICSLRSR